MNTEPKNTPKTEEFDLDSGVVLLHKATRFSSLWTQESAETKVVWITLLLLANVNGEVRATDGEIATASGLSADQTLDAIARLSRPDPMSRIQDRGGRRIVRDTDGILRIANYAHYNAEAMRRERQKQRNRDAQAAFRGRLFSNAPVLSEAAFGEFWKLYPRKVGKRQSEVAYAAAIKRAPHVAIIEGLKKAVDAWATNETEVAFIPHPTTWLNGDRWQDDPKVVAPKSESVFELRFKLDAIESEMKRHPGNREAIGFTGNREDVQNYIALRKRAEDITRRIAGVTQ